MNEIRVPQMGEGLQEVRILEFLKRPGEQVRKGDPIYVIETDKTTVELESPRAGTLQEWVVDAGAVVAVGGVVGSFVESAGASDAGSSAPAVADKRVIPPRTRAYAREKGLAEAVLQDIPAADGRKLFPADIDAFLKRGASATEQSSRVGHYKVMPVSANQRAFIYRLRRSATVAIPGTISMLLPARGKLITAGSDGKPKPLRAVAYAVSRAAVGHPVFRSILVDDETVRLYDHVNLGIAVAMPGDELITAVIDNADTIAETDFAATYSREIKRAAAEGSKARDDTQILLTYLGEWGITEAVPTLVSPANSVIFLGAIQNGECRLTMTFDHRLANGAGAASFLRDVAAILGGDVQA